jgi:hypothetical protein
MGSPEVLRPIRMPRIGEALKVKANREQIISPIWNGRRGFQGTYLASYVTTVRLNLPLPAKTFRRAVVKPVGETETTNSCDAHTNTAFTARLLAPTRPAC